MQRNFFVTMSAATEKTTAPEGAPETTAEKSYMYHPREVKTKEYRDAHHVSWSVHTRPLPKDPNRYDRLVLGAVAALRKEKRNPTVLRVLEHVKENAAPGAHNIPFVHIVFFFLSFFLLVSCLCITVVVNTMGG